jgi:histone deacetylase HOS2
VIPPDLGGIRDEVEQKIKEELDERDEEGRKDKEEGVGVPMEH